MIKLFGKAVFICIIILSTQSPCQSTSEYVQSGFTDYQKGEYNSAIQMFTKAIDNSDTEVNRGKVESSEKTYTQQQEKTNTDISKKSYTQTSKKTYTDVSQKEYIDTQMKSYVATPLEYEGDEPAKIFLYRGWTYFQSGNKEAALDDFDKAVSLDPNLSEIYFRKAIVSYDVDPDIACPNLVKAIDRGYESAQKLYDLICK